MEIVVERSINWTPFIAAGAALGGALVGAISIFLLELWRRVLDGISAARLVRLEIVTNVTISRMALDGKGTAVSTSDSDWRCRVN